MQEIHSAAEATLESALDETPAPLRVVIAYGDLAAGKRAMHVMGELGKRVDDNVQFHTLPWRFDLLADADWRAMATRDALSAEMLIVATSDNGPLPPGVALWIEETIHQKRGTSAAVVALLGHAGNVEAGPRHWQAIKTAAREAGLDFFSPAQSRAQTTGPA